MSVLPPEPRIRNAVHAGQITGPLGTIWDPAARPAVWVQVELADGRHLDLPGRAHAWRRNPDVIQVQVVVDDRTMLPWMPASAVRRRDAARDSV